MDQEKFRRRKSGQIPRFGEWEDANEMPITQYFENAREAGLVPAADTYKSSSSSSASSAAFHYNSYYHSAAQTLKIPSHNLHIPPSRNLHSHIKTAKSKEKRGLQTRVYDANVQPNKAYPNVSRKKQHQSDVVQRSRPTPKPVDEDLYKIPPDLLHSSKGKKMPGFFTCLVPCAT